VFRKVYKVRRSKRAALFMAHKAIPTTSKRKGTAVIDPNYRIIQIVDIPPNLTHERLGFHTCSWGRCKQSHIPSD
jgi:hypothetical protein